MYHATLLWDLCDLINLSQRTQLEMLREASSNWIQVIKKAFKWLFIYDSSDAKSLFSMMQL